MSPRPRARWWRLIDWRVVAAAGVPVWAAVIGFVAWDKARPHSAKPAPIALIPHTGAPGPAEVAPPPKEQPAAPPVVIVPVVITQP
ncbi:MAG TPA: hypothetical protein VFG68_18655, partial [Fimbriiglobus sp.]|nr:hypothetical protein [Fimbriiglobus sp.]